MSTVVVNNITQSLDGTRLTVRGDILIGKNVQSLYFSLDECWKHMVVADGSPFLAAMIPAASQLGDDLYVAAPANKMLISGAKAINDQLVRWDVGFSTVRASSEVKVDDSFLTDGIACFFSGGVDSFYTLLKNKKEITHLIFIHGLDIPLRDRRLHNDVISHLEKVAAAEHVTLIEVSTNVRSIIDPLVQWDYGDGGSIAAVGLLLRAGFKKIYIASSNSTNHLRPLGTHPDIDPLWSTESLQFVHDGAEANRLEKIMTQIAHSPTALQHLRVCYKNGFGRYNCDDCAKCIRTKVDLAIAGVLGKATTFRKPINFKKLSKIDTRVYGNHVHFRDSLAYLQENNSSSELREALEKLLSRQYDISVYKKTRDYLRYLDGKYNRNRLYKLLSRSGILK